MRKKNQNRKTVRPQSSGKTAKRQAKTKKRQAKKFKPSGKKNQKRQAKIKEKRQAGKNYRNRTSVSIYLYPQYTFSPTNVSAL